jgi:hypothetical protein
MFAALTSTLALVPPKTPTMPTMFIANVSLLVPEGRHTYTWYYDGAHQRERMDYNADTTGRTNDGANSAIFHYHPNASSCITDYDCATIYSWAPGSACHGYSTANELEVFWGWLAGDEFTHEPAAYLGRDSAAGCDIWQHVSKGMYPALFNETCCVAGGDAGGSVTPVWDHWIERNPPQLEVHNFTAFQAVESFAPGTFTPPAPCPVTLLPRQQLLRQRHGHQQQQQQQQQRRRGGH